MKTLYSYESFRVDIPTKEAKILTGKLFIPSSAPEEKSPGILISHGANNEYSAMEAYAAKLASSGCTVLLFNQYNHSRRNDRIKYTATAEADTCCFICRVVKMAAAFSAKPGFYSPIHKSRCPADNRCNGMLYGKKFPHRCPDATGRFRCGFFQPEGCVSVVRFNEPVCSKLVFNALFVYRNIRKLDTGAFGQQYHIPPENNQGLYIFNLLGYNHRHSDYIIPQVFTVRNFFYRMCIPPVLQRSHGRKCVCLCSSCIYQR